MSDTINIKRYRLVPHTTGDSRGRRWKLAQLAPAGATAQPSESMYASPLRT